jgi:hypothetical protein
LNILRNLVWKSLLVKHLRQSIVEAFSDSVYPGDDALVDDDKYHLEQRQIKSFFKGRSWDKLSLHCLNSEYIGDASACLGFMRGEAVRYYLPAFMLMSLDEYDNADLIVDSTIAALTPQEQGGKKLQQFAAWAELFSEKQHNVIYKFLHHIKEHHADDLGNEADMALEYWSERK